MKSSSTIAAQATPPGRGGIGIIRVSGPKALFIAEKIIHKETAILDPIPASDKLPENISEKTITPRQAQQHVFYDETGEAMDEGILLFFKSPHSFTGEDVVEFQGHGGPVVMDRVLQRILSLGAEVARPGEFSERAFLNDKIDLAQAEAIADLIDSTSQQAARYALRSLQGEFSKKIHELVEDMIRLRLYVEAAIDFPEEEIDFLSNDGVMSDLVRLIHAVDEVLDTAKQGQLLREGMTVVIAGKPNAGKSSLLNALSGRDTAIITEIPGTTRDVLREYLSIDGIPLHVIDTAGLRQTEDPVEQEGVRRAMEEIKKADQILLMVDSTTTEDITPEALWPDFKELDLSDKKITVIRNKADLTKEPVGLYYEKELCVIRVSVKKKEGLDLLRTHLKECVGVKQNTEGGFIARARHLDALRRARSFLTQGQDQLQTSKAGELLAEDLREAQKALGEITGEFTPDDLLGRIFSTFCIGK